MIKFLDGRSIKLLIYGLMNGMSLLLSSSVINFWLASYKIDPKIIGLFSIIVLPYALKYFIALFINSLDLKKKQFKLWLSCSVLLIAISQIIMSNFSIPDDLLWVALNGFLIALFSVVQDIILSSHRIKEYPRASQVNATALYSAGYRVGMLITGAGTIFCSAYISWRDIFLLLAVIYGLLAIFIVIFYHDKSGVSALELPSTKKSIWYKIFVLPFENFGSVSKLCWLFAFVMLYRLVENMLVVMINPFLIDVGYSNQEIAIVFRGLGTVAVILGGFCCARLTKKFGVHNCIIYFGIAHSLGIILLMVPCFIGKSILILYIISIYEALISGMSMTIYISSISSSCRGEYTASQYALMSSGMGLSRVIFPSFSGFLVAKFSMLGFFVIALILSVICIGIIYYAINRKYLSFVNA